MRRLLIAAALSLLSAPAFAQQSLEQPATPDDGVGIDYTKPYVNDLLLRSGPIQNGNRIATGYVLLRGAIELDCDELQAVFERSPTDFFAQAAYVSCVATQEAFGKPEYEYFPLQTGPGLDNKPYIPDANSGPLTRHLPLSPSHPNAQN
jgi:hypothetical protein